MSEQKGPLCLCNQLCFPLYAASKEVVRRYKPLLDELDLTYTQYIAMMVMWEHGEVSVKQMGELLYLDSGTLTPLLKCMEAKGYITRHRSEQDERVLLCRLTEAGKALETRAAEVPVRMAACMPLTGEEAATLYQLLYKILA